MFISPRITKAVLLWMLTTSDATIFLSDGREGLLTGVSREDGSGKCFNVHVLVGREVVSFFTRIV